MKRKNNIKKGIVISNKMNKTIVVLITKLIKHKIYGKYIKKRFKIYAHDKYNKCNIGDVVFIKEFRPLSKKKSWILYKKIKNK